MKIDVPFGEVADRVSILRIKESRLVGAEPVANSRRHREVIEAAWLAEGLPALDGLPQWAELEAVNAALWDVEDSLRACEREGRFDDTFVGLARSVYRLNDRRAALKRAIDVALASPLVEEKSYRT